MCKPEIIWIAFFTMHISPQGSIGTLLHINYDFLYYVPFMACKSTWLWDKSYNQMKPWYSFSYIKSKDCSSLTGSIFYISD